MLVGVTGEPGSGKSTVSAEIHAALVGAGVAAAVVPMDGFHLANVELARLGLADRKGAAETFDAWGFLALLQRLRRREEPVVYAPTYDRGLEESVAGAVPVPDGVRVVLTEGNYLLLDAEPWRRLHALLDEVWYVEVDDELRRSRLRTRHVDFGKPPDIAAAWVASVDEPNARLIRGGRARADVVVRLDSTPPGPGRRARP